MYTLYLDISSLPLIIINREEVIHCALVEREETWFSYENWNFSLSGNWEWIYNSTIHISLEIQPVTHAGCSFSIVCTRIVAGQSLKMWLKGLIKLFSWIYKTFLCLGSRGQYMCSNKTYTQCQKRSCRNGHLENWHLCPKFIGTWWCDKICRRKH